MTDEARTADSLLPSNQMVEDLDNLRHMLGVASNTKARDYGSRNYYNTSDGGPDVDSMKRLQALGFVIPGRPSYWHATEAGCKAIGLNAKQINRALYDN
jgi:hypothetical protein